jgi:hypothetical protein
MRPRVRVVVIALLSIQCIAQASPQKVSLDLATVTVWLGMTRQEVVSKCASAGFSQLYADKNSITFENGDDGYWTGFKDDRLVFASREWYSSKGNLDAFQSTIAALAAVSDSESAPLNCTIRHEPLNTPENQFNRVFINCGKRSFLLTEGTMNKKKVVGVSERIGEVPAK